MGGGEEARYIGRHGTKRLAKAALIAAVPPLMLKTPANPDGLSMEVFDGLRKAAIADRASWQIWGLPNCGKGDPMQTMRVAHGAPAARFRNVEMG